MREKREKEACIGMIAIKVRGVNGWFTGKY